MIKLCNSYGLFALKTYRTGGAENSFKTMSLDETIFPIGK